MAFKKVFKEPFTNSTNGSFSGNSREPQSTLCSRMWGTPVLLAGGVRNAMENTLFSSSFSIRISLAPVFLWRSIYPVEWMSVRFSCVTISYAGMFSIFIFSSKSPVWRQCRQIGFIFYHIQACKNYARTLFIRYIIPSSR